MLPGVLRMMREQQQNLANELPVVSFHGGLYFPQTPTGGFMTLHMKLPYYLRLLL